MEEILDLQRRNLPYVIDHSEKMSEGFVTVEHDLDTLSQIHGGLGHMVAKQDGKIIGYALTMLREYGDEIEVLRPMFQMFKQTTYDNRYLNEFDFVVMGQVCIDKRFRGKGIFRRLYSNMSQVLKENYQLIVTEIDTANSRSMNAHLGVGFQVIHIYRSDDGVEWHIVALDLR